MGLFYPLEKAGIVNPRNVYYNLSIPRLFEHALSKGEGVLSSSGAFAVWTGKYTGRSPKDRFIVCDERTEKEIDWGAVNIPIEPDRYRKLKEKLLSYLQQRDVYVCDAFVGADPDYRMPVRFINEFAYQGVFVQNMFLEATREELARFVPQFTVICAPNFHAIPEVDGVRSEAFVIINFTEGMVIIGGTSYGGEIKKAIFTVMNFLLPEKGVLPMHCSANVGDEDDVAVFFGLSGTGKTSLSADIQRKLIGDDEHGWSDKGIFNFEGGCYAKCINLSKEKEPQIYHAIRYGAIMENVVLDEETREPDFSDSRYTENTRVSYPIELIPNALIPGVAGHPRVVIFLTADAFGVMPPVARLSKEEAIYHFILGYTSKLAGTERGIVEPEATFSSCFGAPFMPRNPLVYGKMLGEKIEKYKTRVYLVNTGWTGGPYGLGHRIDIDYTRTIVRTAIEGSIEDEEFYQDSVFKFMVPRKVGDLPEEIFVPKNTWKNPELYDQKAQELRNHFEKAMQKYGLSLG